MGIDPDPHPEDDLEEIRAWLGRSRGDPIESMPDEPIPSSEELVSLARRFHRQLRVALNFSLEETGLSCAAFEILETLDRDPNHHAASIAHELRTSRQAVGRLLRRLVDRGLVEKLPRDAGVRGLALTDEGRTELSTATRRLAGFHAMFGRLSPERRVQVFAGLNVAEAALRPPLRW